MAWTCWPSARAHWMTRILKSRANIRLRFAFFPAAKVGAKRRNPDSTGNASGFLGGEHLKTQSAKKKNAALERYSILAGGILCAMCVRHAPNGLASFGLVTPLACISVAHC